MPRQNLVRIFQLVSYLLVSCSAIASGRYDYFHHLRTGSEEIRAMYPDAEGRVWIGTIHGLMRYGDFPLEDRHGNYDYYPKKFRAGIYSIQDYDGHRLLIRTLDDGRYLVYDPGSNQIESDLTDVLAEWGVEHGNDWNLNIKTDRQHNLWIYWDGNLLFKEAGTAHPVKVADIPEHIKAISTNTDELCILAGGSIYIYSISDFTLKAKIASIENQNVRSRSATIDEAGNVWISGDNLSRYDRSQSQWTTVKQNIFITDMVASKRGELLVATNTSGILRFDSAGKELQKIRHNPYDPTSLAADNIRWIIEDNDTALWVCYDKRIISVCDPSRQYLALRHIPILKERGFDDDIISVMQAGDGSVWFGSNGHGVFRMTEDGTAFDLPEGLGSLNATAIASLFGDSRGRIWIGTYRNGLYCYDDGRIRHFLPQMSIYSILEDKEGRIWLGLLGKGIRYMDGNLTVEPMMVGSHGSEWISGMAYDGKSTIYAASSNGIIAIDTESLKSGHLKGTRSASSIFRNHNVQSVFRDSRGLIWMIGLDNEVPVEVYDPSRDTILQIPRLKDTSVKSIVEDDSKNVWLASEHAIIHIIVNYDMASGSYAFIPSFYRFQDSSEGSEAYYNYRAGCRLRDGRILFGSSDGFLTVSPLDFPPFSAEIPSPKPYIASLKVNNDYIKAANAFNGREVIRDDLSNLEGIELNHDENNLIITIGMKEHAVCYNTDLYYRLGGRDTEWRRLRGNTVELPNLSPGSYTLEIGSEKADGSISTDIVTFGIKIKTPWYAAWWALVIYILLVIAVIAFAIYHYLDRQKQKLYVAQIRRESERQYQLNEMKLRFFTNISHDFRTPLSLIITPLESFMSEESNKSAVKHLRPVYKNAQRLLTLINQILDFRKIELNGAQLNLSYGDIISFVRDICSSFTLFAEDTARQLSFSSTVPSVNMYFDKDKLTKIMMNLLSNAFKFTRSGSEVKVEVCVDGDDVKISVADNGRGIPDDKKEHIFERFYQADEQPVDHIGSGIGLHIVKEFVSLHKGTVCVTDNKPSGAVFTVTLPILKSDPAASNEQKPSDGSTDNAMDEQSVDPRTKLLIVEDNADFREYMKEQLSDEYQVFVASNGKDALEVLGGNEINIIVSDIMMDGMDGLELCHKVKNNIDTSHIPVILLTAKALPEDEVRGYECGADDYVTKPFNMSVLKRRIGKLIDDGRQSRDKFKEKLDVSPSEITITSLDEQFLSTAIKCVEDNMASSDFSVETMSAMLGVHRTQLYKKLTNLTGKSPVEFIRLIRLKRAAQYLAQSQMFVSEIAYTVGFSSPKLFTKHFKEEFGMSPREYQNSHSGSGPESVGQST